MSFASASLKPLPPLYSSLKLRPDILCRVWGEKLLNAVLVSELQQSVKRAFDTLYGRHSFPRLNNEGGKQLAILRADGSPFLRWAGFSAGCSGSVQTQNIPHLMLLGPKTVSKVVTFYRFRRNAIE
ncbi:hypothetical protein KIH24_05670 [Rhizobiales bacterium TNE-4]|nr:hypothetical protein [Rhizobiales bacterium TNE-4]MBV1827111.1 hypothetical protein [Rhizobiales bacterium TNE-4]